MSFIFKPHHVWWRKSLFQVHLWVGIILCAYILVIGVSGSLLVFESELTHLSYPRLLHSSKSKNIRAMSFTDAVNVARSAYPSHQLWFVYLPPNPEENLEAIVSSKDRSYFRIFIDPYTRQIVGELVPNHSWLEWVRQIHIRLFAGKTGSFLNGIGAICLLLMCATGSVIWWSGLRRWTRGLWINFRGSWKRINFDLHSTVGFWTLLILSMWALTAIFFVWPRPVQSFVNRFSSVESAVAPPGFTVPLRGNVPWSDLNGMIQQAKQSSPDARFAGAFFPDNNRSALTLLMERGAAGDFTAMDYVYFDPSTGAQLAIWHRGINPTWGSKLIFWMKPLHFGTSWGIWIKILWATLGCALPLLSITGVLMYWNRYLSRKWRSLKNGIPIQT